jgi:hypothetical protein
MTPRGLIMWVITVDDCVGCGPPEEFLESKKCLMEIFTCENQGLKCKYIGNTVEYLPGLYMKLLQPGLIQSLQDKFNVNLNLDHQITMSVDPGLTM